MLESVQVKGMVKDLEICIAKASFDFYGLRVDDYDYSINDKCHNSHQLMQDAEFDEYGNLLYPYQEDGIYEGYYDAGELNGTCALKVGRDVETSLDGLKRYEGKFIYLIGSDTQEEGNDANEVILANARVLCKFKRE
jgi:hypothetical protein